MNVHKVTRYVAEFTEKESAQLVSDLNRALRLTGACNEGPASPVQGAAARMINDGVADRLLTLKAALLTAKEDE